MNREGGDVTVIVQCVAPSCSHRNKSHVQDCKSRFAHKCAGAGALPGRSFALPDILGELSEHGSFAHFYDLCSTL